MLLVIVLSLTGTMYVAWQFATEQEEAYNTQRLIRKEAAVQRSLEYTLGPLTAHLPNQRYSGCFFRSNL